MNKINVSNGRQVQNFGKQIKRPKNASLKKVAALDLETDPFKFGRVPCPFAGGIYDGETYVDFWGDDCVLQIVDYLAHRKEPLCLYAHNGGKFDWWYFSDFLNDPLMFINTRLVRAQLMHHEVRDSFSILPVPLSAMQKDKIDYSTFEFDERNKHANRKRILRYLKSDCVYLYDNVTRFIETFGQTLTMGSASWRVLTSMHEVPKMSAEDDAEIRPFYFGGRVECFESGNLRDSFKLYDINSSYPDVMKRCQHPASINCDYPRRLPDSGVYFAEIIADSDGALPIKIKGSLRFPHVRNETFYACSHEIHEAENLGLLRIKKIRNVFHFHKTQNFAAFVDRCMNEKIAAEMAGDKSMRLFWKLICNAAYGKGGSNPDNYRDVRLFETRESMFSENDAIENIERRWTHCGNFGSRILADRPVEHRNFLNVAMAASITSAARAHLLRALHRATRPVYCDTDSIICTALDMPHHPTKVGAWKLEAEADEISIAGKKLYAAFKRGQCVKGAAKGVGIRVKNEGHGIAPELLRQIADGVPSDEIGIEAPSLTLGKTARFQKRTLARTV